MSSISYTDNTCCLQCKNSFFVSVFAANIMCYIVPVWLLKYFPGGTEKDGIILHQKEERLIFMQTNIQQNRKALALVIKIEADSINTSLQTHRAPLCGSWVE